MGRQPYSTNTFLIDLPLDPAAMSRDAPSFLLHLPAELQNITPPTFAAILTPRLMAPMAGISDEALMGTLRGRLHDRLLGTGPFFAGRPVHIPVGAFAN
jgi:hypothetical protein